MIIIKRILILDNERNAEDAIKKKLYSGQDCIFVSLTPATSYVLERLNIPYKTPENYPLGYERFSLGLNNYHKIEKFTEGLDNKLFENHKILNLRPARYSMYFLKNIFDVTIITVHLLHTIIYEEKPDEIIIYENVSMGEENGSWGYNADESIVSLVMKLDSWNVPIVFIDRANISGELSERKTLTSPFQLKRKIGNFIRKNDFLFNLAIIADRWGIIESVKYGSMQIFSKKTHPLLIYESGYNWDDTLPELFEHGFCPIHHLYDDFIAENIHKEDNIWNEQIRKYCENDPTFKELVNCKEIDVSSLVIDRVVRVISQSVINSLVAYKSYIYTIKKLKIKAHLFSIHTHGISQALVQAAHDMKIPVFSWQHGGAGYYFHPMILYGECLYSDYHFVFGEETAKNYQDIAAHLGIREIPKFVPIGSSSIDRLSTSYSKRKECVETIVYVNTTYSLNYQYVSHPIIPFEYDAQIWRIQKAVMDLSKRCSDKKVIFKLHPTHTNKKPLIDYATDNKIDNIQFIVQEQTMNDLLVSGDLFIFDTISTGILQALVTNKPIFVYMGTTKIEKRITDILGKRAFLYNNIPQFCDAIRRFLENKDFPINTDERKIDYYNQDFLKSFGTFQGDGKSAQRAANFLLNIIERKKYENVILPCT